MSKTHSTLDTHLCRIGLASFKHASAVVSRHVPRATHEVVDMLAQCRGLRAVLARANAELVCRHEVRPLMNLRKRSVRAREY